jgi:hypothetical protein
MIRNNHSCVVQLDLRRDKSKRSKCLPRIRRDFLTSIDNKDLLGSVDNIVTYQ